jgi:hypothetical protein
MRAMKISDNFLGGHLHFIFARFRTHTHTHTHTHSHLTLFRVRLLFALKSYHVLPTISLVSQSVRRLRSSLIPTCTKKCQFDTFEIIFSRANHPLYLLQFTLTFVFRKSNSKQQQKGYDMNNNMKRKQANKRKLFLSWLTTYFSRRTV